MATNSPQNHTIRHEQPTCLRSHSLESLALIVASLNSAQTSLNTAQAALQRICEIPQNVAVVARNVSSGDSMDVTTGGPEQTMAQRSGSAISLSDSNSDHATTSTRPPTPQSPPPDERWYTVTVGRNPGVFHGSAEVMDNVCGIPGGNPTRYRTEAQARAAFDSALAARLVRQVTITTIIP